jgi:hypothetical protein
MSCSPLYVRYEVGVLMMSLRVSPAGACTGVVLQTKVETKDGL